MSEAPKNKRASDHVVMALARLIADAKAGSIEAMGVVVVDPRGLPRVHFAGDSDLLPHVYFGAGMLQATFMNQVISAPGAAQMNSGLIVPQ